MHMFCNTLNKAIQNTTILYKIFEFQKNRISCCKVCRKQSSLYSTQHMEFHFRKYLRNVRRIISVRDEQNAMRR